MVLLIRCWHSTSSLTSQRALRYCPKSHLPEQSSILRCDNVLKNQHNRYSTLPTAESSIVRDIQKFRCMPSWSRMTKSSALSPRVFISTTFQSNSSHTHQWHSNRISGIIFSQPSLRTYRCSVWKTIRMDWNPSCQSRRSSPIQILGMKICHECFPAVELTFQTSNNYVYPSFLQFLFTSFIAHLHRNTP